MPTDEIHDYFDKVVEPFFNFYAEDRSDYSYIQKVIQSTPKNAQVLDLGCGFGRFTNYLHEQKFSVLGMDYSEKMLEKARSLYPCMEFKLRDVRKLNINQEFDLVFCHWLLMYFPPETLPLALNNIKKASTDLIYLSFRLGDGKVSVPDPLKPELTLTMWLYSEEDILKHFEGYELVFKEVKEPDHPVEDLRYPKIFVLLKKRK